MASPVPQPSAPRVAVSIVVWRSRREQVERCLEALAAGSVVPGRVHVLSNEDHDVAGSGWDTLSCAGLDVLVERSAVNLGFAGGHNAVLSGLFAESVWDAVLVLNPDVALEKDALRQLLSFRQTDGRPILVGPLLELASGDMLEGEGTIDTAGIVWTRTGRHLDAMQGRPLDEAPVDAVHTAGISGACLLVSRAVHDYLVSVTGEFFDGDFLAYREDAELGLRGQAVGVSSWLVPAARGRHGRSLRGTTRATSAHVNRLGVRNRFLIRFKYGRRRPGGYVGAPLRDVTVLAAVVLRERSSWAGVVDAWRLRGRMRAKGRVVCAASRGRVR